MTGFEPNGYSDIELHEDLTYLLLNNQNHPERAVLLPDIAANIITKCRVELQKEIKRLNEQLQWNKFEDILPEDGKAIMTWNGEDRCIDYYNKGKSDNAEVTRMLAEDFHAPSMFTDKPVTHWRYLPDPPKEK
jgi:hypothetical protein